MASIDDDQKTKPKSFIHWISTSDAMDCEVRIYGPLFTCHNPNEVEDYLKLLNPESRIDFKSAKMDRNLAKELKILSR